ncbi:hypothetical protein PHLGIDRAFT_448834 [Phlebiopsis gigantea 11061_1 CR5-6]|uniref:Uncharacterized protein n=1 Tax=Phlebiopsis gigantea (strain 11061_1 CR5-6) TaxID=745531 RepID=A0A0C3NNM5_PHLG1|nr:hypothetical protein PHLGIDRAFT_448834 [Phlebiopsis gigantea 11061_1 CR5-6]
MNASRSKCGDVSSGATGGGEGRRARGAGSTSESSEPSASGSLSSESSRGANGAGRCGSGSQRRSASYARWASSRRPSSGRTQRRLPRVMASLSTRSRKSGAVMSVRSARHVAERARREGRGRSWRIGRRSSLGSWPSSGTGVLS